MRSGFGVVALVVAVVVVVGDVVVDVVVGDGVTVAGAAGVLKDLRSETVYPLLWVTDLTV